MQNKSHAVMAQRNEPNDSPDDFPTPPWATRALVNHVIGPAQVKGMSCLEPACGRGYMSKPLAEYFHKVDSSDFIDYGFGAVSNFLNPSNNFGSYDWVITNPPFRLAQEFIQTSLTVANHGVAILARTVFLESRARYESLFKENPPHYFAQFVERVPMVRGRVDAKASTATGYAWFVWLKNEPQKTSNLVWIPPCRRQLEKPQDYH